MLKIVARRIRRRRGAAAIEYGIIAATVIVAVLSILQETGVRLESVFGQVGDVLADASRSNNAAQPSSTPAAPLFGTFESAYQTWANETCPSGVPVFVGPAAAFSAPGCNSLSESGLYNELVKNAIENSAANLKGSILVSGLYGSKNPVVVPSLDGNGTGFQFSPAYYAILYEHSSNSGISFAIVTNGFYIDSTDLKSIYDACINEGGTIGTSFYNNLPYRYYCTNGSYYGNGAIAAVLP